MWLCFSITSIPSGAAYGHLPEQVRDGELPLIVGVLNPQLGQDPVLRTVTWCPDRVVGCWLLSELYCQRYQVAVTTHVQQYERSGHVAMICFTSNGRDVMQQRVVYQVHVAVLLDKHTHTELVAWHIYRLELQLMGDHLCG